MSLRVVRCLEGQRGKARKGDYCGVMYCHAWVDAASTRVTETDPLGVG
jgi:hypothetical protein